MSKNNYAGIHPYIVKQVRYHAHRLIRHSAIHGVEVEDLEQELMLDYLSRKQAYNPEKAKWSTFIDRIFNHKCACLIETACAQKRGTGLAEFSLDTWLEDGDGEDNALPDPATEDLTSHDLQIDLERAVQQMPPHFVLLLVDLRTLSISEISRKTKTPRSTLYGTLSKLRASLEKGDFAEYLH
ncbi:sigma-70 family RNA polymerase sigma factor [Bartonella queenslandensis]|uniref:sigma-70 family RNA polymerase sigma factor n=1 Tax=Bartonella queenslandensis TaxID=481138 RepID=UPI001BA95D13|nr:sigma-70 family RNA polymerase sigma factor [Bartonella queenslandensis]